MCEKAQKSFRNSERLTKVYSNSDILFLLCIYIKRQKLIIKTYKQHSTTRTFQQLLAIKLLKFFPQCFFFPSMPLRVINFYAVNLATSNNSFPLFSLSLLICRYKETRLSKLATTICRILNKQLLKFFNERTVKGIL